MMGYELVDLDDPAAVAALAEMDPPRRPIQPQQLLLVDAINAGNKRVVIEVPRRASKSTTVFCLLLGRCACRPGYKVTFSAQTGTAGTAMFEEWVRDGLDAVAPPDDLDVPPWLRGTRTKSKAQQRQLALFGEDLIAASQEDQPASSGRNFQTRIGNSRPGIRFDNHSTFMVLKPEHGAYRGKAADVSWLDEAQEIDPGEGDALLAGILPLQDTRPGSQVIISGTAGEVKLGPFWNFLNKLRSGEDVGGIDYAVDESTPWELVENEDTAMQLLESVHPGVGTLTTIETMRENYRDIPRPQWAREYLSLWPETFGALAVPLEQWIAAARAVKPRRPDRVAFGLDIKPGGSVAAIVAAWRSANGVAHAEVVEHRSGTVWIPDRLQELTQRYRGATVAFDDIAEGKATATEAARLKPRPNMKLQTYSETAAGCVQVLRELERGTFRHYDQIGLNDAVNHAAKREIRGHQGMWIWTPAQPGDDITTLLAATRALRNWDLNFATRRSGFSPVMGD